MQKTAVILLVVGIVGLALVIAGGVLAGTKYFQKMIHNKVEDDVPLKNGSSSFDTWKDPPADVYMQFYFFDVQNVDEIVNGSKPVVVERGPYTYREVRSKDNMTFSDHGKKLLYREPKSYVLDLEKSVGDPAKDQITTINLLSLSVAAMLRYEKSFWQTVAGEILWGLNQTLFITHSVEQHLWGYNIPSLLEDLKKALAVFGIHLPIPDKIGLFTGDTGNDTADGMYQIFTGVGDLDKYNLIDQWRGRPNLTFWPDDYCNMINGTDGTGWHPFIDKSDVLYIFSSDICRSIYATYKRSYDFNGIPLYRFVPPESVFADHIENPNNTGYCTPGPANCLKAGVLNVTECKGAPLIMSQPHFFEGAKEYIDAITGMHPSVQHQTYLDVEPLTGASLSLAKKLQINADLQKYPVLSDLDHMNQTIFPIVWVNESAMLNSDGIHKFKKEVQTPIKITEGVKFGLIGLGCLIILIVVIIAVYLFVIKPRRSDDQPLLTTSSDADGDDSLIRA